jgi:hypothetical protein
VKIVAGIARIARRAAARLALPVSVATTLAALNIFVMPAHGADLDYGPYGPLPYGNQPPPPYDYRYDHPPGHYVPDRRGGYDERRYGDQGYERPPYPTYRTPPDGYARDDYRGYRDDRSYRRYGYTDPYYDPYGGAPRPPAPIMGPPRGWVGDPRALPDDRWVDAAPPYQPWFPYPPPRW